MGLSGCEKTCCSLSPNLLAFLASESSTIQSDSKIPPSRDPKLGFQKGEIHITSAHRINRQRNSADFLVALVALVAQAHWDTYSGCHDRSLKSLEAEELKQEPRRGWGPGDGDP